MPPKTTATFDCHGDTIILALLERTTNQAIVTQSVRGSYVLSEVFPDANTSNTSRCQKRNFSACIFLSSLEVSCCQSRNNRLLGGYTNNTPNKQEPISSHCLETELFTVMTLQETAIQKDPQVTPCGNRWYLQGVGVSDQRLLLGQSHVLRTNIDLSQ